MMKRLLALGMVLLSSFIFAVDSPNFILLKQDASTFDITLPVNATTGFSWYLQSYDHNLMTLMSYHYARDVSASNIVGAGGKAVFTFSANPGFFDAPQITTVKFILIRPWEGPTDQSNITLVTVLSPPASGGQGLAKVPTVEDMPLGNHSPKQDSNWLALPKTNS